MHILGCVDVRISPSVARENWNCRRDARRGGGGVFLTDPSPYLCEFRRKTPPWNDLNIHGTIEISFLHAIDALRICFIFILCQERIS